MCKDNRRSPPSKDPDLFDDLWSSLTDSATDFTRSLVGLPMFYRPHNDDHPDAITVFAEPSILHPKIITFHLDKDIDSIAGPFRIVSRPITAFDVFSQVWKPDSLSGSGMMFLFGSPLENAHWLHHPGYKFTSDWMFRPFTRPDEWIRKSMEEFDRRFANFHQHKNLEDTKLETDPLSQAVKQKHGEEHCTKRGKIVGKLEELLDQRFEQNENSMKESYSTRTTTTTHVTQNADGSVYKETVTTEQLPDGSTKTTRIVNTTPGEGDKPTTTETTVTTIPPSATKEPLELSRKRYSRLRMPEKPHAEEKSQFEERKEVPGKKDVDQRNWTWWFWSKK